MTTFIHKALLQSRTPIIQLKRFRGKINIQRPRAPHYERAKVLALVQPIYPDRKATLKPIDLCTKQTDKIKHVVHDNPFETIIAKECLNWFNHSKMVAFFHINSFRAEDRFKASIALKFENMHLKEYGRAVMEKALTGTNYQAVLSLFRSQNMMVFSPEHTSVTKLIKLTKKFPQMILMAGVVEGRLLSRNELIAYSKMPNIQVARAGLAQAINMAAVQLMSHLTHHQTALVSSLQQHIEIQGQKVQDNAQNTTTKESNAPDINEELTPTTKE